METILPVTIHISASVVVPGDIMSAWLTLRLLMKPNDWAYGNRKLLRKQMLNKHTDLCGKPNISFWLYIFRVLSCSSIAKSITMNMCKQSVKNKPIFTTRCHASPVYAMALTSVVTVAGI